MWQLRNGGEVQGLNIFSLMNFWFLNQTEYLYVRHMRKPPAVVGNAPVKQMNRLTLDNIIIELNRSYPELVDRFSQAYNFVAAEFANDIRILPSKFERTCRYCENSYPEVTFNHEAHSIPEFLGNHLSLSPYECDRCNKLFSTYENQFSKFFGHLITISGTKGKNGIPNSRSGDNKTIAQKEKFYKNESGILFGNTNRNEENAKYDIENNLFKITSCSEKYIPISIYKILVKMAVGILPEYLNEISKELNPFLLDKKHKNLIENELFKMIIYTSSRRYESTSIFLFKKNSKDNIPDYCFLLFYDHFMMQILFHHHLLIHIQSFRSTQFFHQS